MEFMNVRGLVLLPIITYASNDQMKRTLWDNMTNLARQTLGSKWIVIGNFNKKMFCHERKTQKRVSRCQTI